MVWTTRWFNENMTSYDQTVTGFACCGGHKGNVDGTNMIANHSAVQSCSLEAV